MSVPERRRVDAHTHPRVTLPRLARTVLFLHASAGRYGADRQLEALVTHLDHDRFRPVVVLGERGSLAERLAGAGIEVHVRRLAVLGRRLVSGRGAASLAAQVARDRLDLGRLARERDAAIIHTNSSIIVSGQSVARRAGAAHLLHVREIYDGSAGQVGQWLWPLYRRHLLRADGLACVSRAAASQFDGCDRAFVLHDGITWFPGRRPRQAARRALGIDPDRFVVAVIGRVSDWKGQDVLALALTEAPLAEIGAMGLVAGDPAPGQHHHERELIRLRDELGLGDRFRLLGFREDLETVFGAADVVAAPSTHPDAFPNAALEAAIAGLPLVAVDTGGLPEILRDGRTGRLVPQGDARRLAGVLRELAENPDQSRRLGEAAAADVRDRFGFQQMLDAVEDRYGRLLAARTG